METVIFSAELAAPPLASNDIVLRRGKVFEVGEYPDKGFSLTADEARAAVAAFAPCNADLEHKNTVLDGKIGGLVGVEMGADGKTLFGTVAEPKWLSDVLGNEPRKVSLTWDKAAKTITGIAHVLNPRITDAAVFNAYADFSGDANFRYESATERDNIPDEDFGDVANKLFPARTQDEFRDSMRELAGADDPTAVKARLLEIATRKGFKTVNPYPWPTTGISAPLGSESSYFSHEDTQNMKVFIPNANGSRVGTVEEVVTFTGGSIGPDTRGLQIQDDAGHMSRATPEQIVAFTGGKVAFAAPVAAVTPEIQERLDRLAQFEADQKNADAIAIAKDAEAKFAALLKDKKVVPADKEDFVAAFTIAGRYDKEREGLAYFSADAPEAKFSLVAFMQKQFEAKPEHNLTEEKDAGFSGDDIAIFDAPTTSATDPKDGETKPINDVVNSTLNGSFARPDGK
ncbi:MAG: hypothetical protein KY445_02755 [Armatimonadetes bacterium]|nr:hypothetical protein [Armatimonadota bacterium]